MSVLEDLQRKVREGKVVPFVGSGVSMAVKDHQWSGQFFRASKPRKTKHVRIGRDF